MIRFASLVKRISASKPSLKNPLQLHRASAFLSSQPEICNTTWNMGIDAIFGLLGGRDTNTPKPDDT